MGTVVINLIGAPGAGKSTGAAYIFAKLKMANVNAEYIGEFAKDKVWENNEKVFKCQEYIFGKQSYRIARCSDEVEVIITDSPLVLSSYYNRNGVLGDSFNQTVMNVFNSYDNVTYFINRVKKYNPAGRHQTELESDKVADELKNFLGKNNIKYTVINGQINDYDKVVIDILNILDERENMI